MSPVQQLLFPQTHFHFVTDAAGLDRRGPSFRVFPTTTVYRERVVSEHAGYVVVEKFGAAAFAADAGVAAEVPRLEETHR